MPAPGGDCQRELLRWSGSGELVERRLVTAGTTGKDSQAEVLPATPSED